MNTRRLRLLSFAFSAAISALGLSACVLGEDAQTLVEDGLHHDDGLTASFAPPNDDPDLDEADGLESEEEAAIEGELAEEGAADPVDGVDADGIEEIDVTGLGEDQIQHLLATKRVASPVPGRKVTYAYGVKNKRYAAGYHTGQDYAAPVGTAVVAVRSGKIRWSNNQGGAYGRWIGLDADNGRTYVYCHLSSRRYGAGRKVKAGERIGRVGATGNVTGPHLHFEDHPKGPFRYGQVRKPKW